MRAEEELNEASLINSYNSKDCSTHTKAVTL